MKLDMAPYRKVAAAANKSWGLGLTDEQIKTMSFDELEGHCWAANSMQYAIDHLAKVMCFNDDQKKEFADAVFAKDHTYVDVYDDAQFERAGRRLQQKFGKTILNSGEFIEDVTILDTLSAIHDGWVRDNAKKFNKEGREGKRYQHLPIEMIGWEEAKLDLLFLQPILEAVGVKVNEETLRHAYDKRVKDFYKDNNLNNEEDISNYIMNIDKHYDAVSELNTPKDKQVADQMAGQVLDRLTFGKQEDIRVNYMKKSEED